MELKQYLPPFLLNSSIFSSLFETYQNEVGNISISKEDLLKQFFPQTATWGLSLWEKFLNISINESNSIEFRRANILSRMSKHSPVTVETLKNLIKNFTDGNVDILQDIPRYSFYISMDIASKAINFKDLFESIEIIKPAHLDYSLSANFNSTDKGIYNCACCISGESISIYPYVATNFETNVQVDLGSVIQNIETSTLYPKEV